MSLKRKYQRWVSEVRIPPMLRLRTYTKFLTAPFRLLFESWGKPRFRDLLMGLPAVACVIFGLLLVGKSQVQRRNLSGDYLRAGRAAAASEDFPAAKLYLKRVLQRNRGYIGDAQYELAVMMEEQEQPDRAMALLRKLAPDNQRGNRKAHRRMAALLAKKIAMKKTMPELFKLKWHLEAAGDKDSPEMLMAWARYCLATEDLNSAQTYLERAVNHYPELLRTLGDLEVHLGNDKSAVRYFRESQKYLKTELSKDIFNERVRVDYAYTLLKTADMAEARRVLEEGRALNEGGPWLNMLATLMVHNHDLKKLQERPLTELLAVIEKALDYNPNHEDALNRLMQYAEIEVEGNRTLKEVLARVIAKGEKPALAHLAMGNLCWMEGNEDQAMKHFEFALSFREDMAILLNNLAWLVAHNEERPDFDRAMALIESALLQQPDNKSFLDTRGTIHFLKKDWMAARHDLDLALSGVRDKRAVHRKLAVVYSELDFPEVAREHELLANQK